MVCVGLLEHADKIESKSAGIPVYCSDPSTNMHPPVPLQGRTVPCDFIGFAKSQNPIKAVDDEVGVA